MSQVEEESEGWYRLRTVARDWSSDDDDTLPEVCLSPLLTASASAVPMVCRRSPPRRSGRKETTGGTDTAHEGRLVCLLSGVRSVI